MTFIHKNMNLTSLLLLTNNSLRNSSGQDSDHYSEQCLLDRDRANTIWIYIPPILILFGTFGNILTIVILCRKSMWKLASSPYFVVLSVADITVLYSGLLRQWIIYLKDLDIRLVSAALCKLHTTLVYTAVDFSVWILVTISVERFICICFPFKAKRICSRGRAKIVMVVLLLLLFLINSHFLFGLGSVYDDDSGDLITHCGIPNSHYLSYYLNIWPWIDLPIFSIIPFVIIIMCNICLITEMSRSWRRKNLLPNGGTKVKPPLTTALLVSLNTLFLFTTGPISVVLICESQWMLNATEDEEARFGLWWAIVNQLMYLNNSVNFIFYCVSGSRFRQELKAMFQRRSTGNPTIFLSTTCETTSM